MMNSAWIKNNFREIRHTLGRYIALVIIIALGVGFFSGLKITKEAMIQTADTYIKDSNMYDFQLISTLGLTKEDERKISGLDGVQEAKGAVYGDFITDYNDHTDMILKAYSITEEINKLSITSGRMPKRANECVVDSLAFTKEDIGKTITISDKNSKDTIGSFAFGEYTIVGLCNSVNYMYISDRGTTSLPGGAVTAFIYMPENGFSFDYYNTMYVSLANSEGQIFSKDYNDAVSSMEQPLTNVLKERAMLRYEDIVEEANDEIDKAKEEYDKAYGKYLNKKSEAKTKLENSRKTLEEGKEEIRRNEDKLSKGENLLRENQRKYSNSLKDYHLFKDKYKRKNQLKEAKSQLDYRKQAIKKYQKEIAEGKEALSQAKIDYKNGQKEYKKAKTEIEMSLKEAKNKLDDGKTEILKAKADIKTLDKPTCYVLDRSKNIGYTCFENDSSVVEGIAKVFPFFFFLVAALVCSSTMTRMVDEQRTQIGTLKALGYSNRAITWKYVSYSGSAAILGCILGYFTGTIAFPYTIWQAYKLLYNFAEIQYVFNGGLFLLMLIVSLLCSVGATYASIKTELAQVPSELMRPKAPKAGKRIFLEYIPFLWSRLGFFPKVSIRNIFRYKKRLIMMILGTGGCMALLLAGLGLNDSISNIAEDQFGTIMKYDYTIAFQEAQTEEKMEKFITDTNELLTECVFISEENYEAATKDGTQKVNVIASEDKDITKVIGLHLDGRQVPFPKDGYVAINDRLADAAGVKIGDTMTLNLNHTEYYDVVIGGIFKNYAYNYMYMSGTTYRQIFHKEPSYENAYATTDSTKLYDISAKIMKDHEASNVIVTEDTKELVNNMMDSLKYIVWLVIACACALAFVVMYNLSNINITERNREIATIKVLGFYSFETYHYVFRENIIITIISGIFGLPAGIWLHRFVMEQIKIEAVSFNIHILPISYIYALMVTFGLTLLVNGILTVKIDRVQMAESLKSVE